MTATPSIEFPSLYTYIIFAQLSTTTTNFISLSTISGTNLGADYSCFDLSISALET